MYRFVDHFISPPYFSALCLTPFSSTFSLSASLFFLLLGPKIIFPSEFSYILSSTLKSFCVNLLIAKSGRIFKGLSPDSWILIALFFFSFFARFPKCLCLCSRTADRTVIFALCDFCPQFLFDRQIELVLGCKKLFNAMQNWVTGDTCARIGAENNSMVGLSLSLRLFITHPNMPIHLSHVLMGDYACFQIYQNI